jgi:hypothetical protein
MADQAQNVFKTPADDASQKDLLSELVGEGKKYKTAEDLARSRLEADIHIQKIELENKEMREKLAAAKSVEDVLEAVRANTASAKETPDPTEKPNATGQALNAEQVAKMVAETVTGLRTKEVRDANLAKANAKMVELFGEKAQEVYLKEANTPELQRVYKELAETNPDKFVELFQPKTTQNQSVDTKGKNTAAMNLNQNTGTVQPGTQLYYAKLRKENPKAYYSPAIQLEMHQRAIADPDKYFGRK